MMHCNPPLRPQQQRPCPFQGENRMEIDIAPFVILPQYSLAWIPHHGKTELQVVLAPTGSGSNHHHLKAVHRKLLCQNQIDGLNATHRGIKRRSIKQKLHWFQDERRANIRLLYHILFERLAVNHCRAFGKPASIHLFCAHHIDFLCIGYHVKVQESFQMYF